MVSRGCPHVCDFCYKEAFFEGGKSFYTQTVDAALAEIERLPGRHLYFLDDHLFGDRRFASALFDGMRGMGRLWQAAGTVNSVLRPDLLEKAVACGLRSLFVGFETLNPANLRRAAQVPEPRRDYGAAIRRLHDLGVMVNGSFVFGMDDDDAPCSTAPSSGRSSRASRRRPSTSSRPIRARRSTSAWRRQGRMLTATGTLYDTRHVVFRPARMTAERAGGRLLAGLPRLLPLGIDPARRGDQAKDWRDRLRHVAYAGGWKKFEPAAALAAGALGDGAAARYAVGGEPVRMDCGSGRFGRGRLDF